MSWLSVARKPGWRALPGQESAGLGPGAPSLGWWTDGWVSGQARPRRWGDEWAPAGHQGGLANDGVAPGLTAQAQLSSAASGPPPQLVSATCPPPPPTALPGTDPKPRALSPNPSVPAGPLRAGGRQPLPPLARPRVNDLTWDKGAEGMCAKSSPRGAHAVCRSGGTRDKATVFPVGSEPEGAMGPPQPRPGRCLGCPQGEQEGVAAHGGPRSPPGGTSPASPTSSQLSPHAPRSPAPQAAERVSEH